MAAEGVSLVVHFLTFFTPGLDPGVLFAALKRIRGSSPRMLSSTN
jgi:hypothetical protein